MIAMESHQFDFLSSEYAVYGTPWHWQYDIEEERVFIPSKAGRAMDCAFFPKEANEHWAAYGGCPKPLTPEEIADGIEKMRRILR